MMTFILTRVGSILTRMAFILIRVGSILAAVILPLLFLITKHFISL
uniref:Uncharacterized protein n=1 Tax=Lepeophtheirus salmonis TaxID=72036 RepID=A0A0K2VIH4_LEPSM